VIALGGALRSPVDGAQRRYTVQRVGCFGPSEDGLSSQGGGGLHNPAGCRGPRSASAAVIDLAAVGRCCSGDVGRFAAGIAVPGLGHDGVGGAGL